MKFDILTLFPEMFPGVIDTSILGRARKAGLLDVRVHNLRDWATDKHHTVDDKPYSGGPGMVLKVDVIDRALHDLKKVNRKQKTENRKTASTVHRSLFTVHPHVVLLTPQGRPFKQAVAHELSQKDHIVLIAGHYEGYDERVRALVDDEISLGDFVMTGGEIAAMAIVDATARLLPGVLGKDESSREESFAVSEVSPNKLSSQEAKQLLEYPHYTRPESYTPLSKPELGALVVPEILKSGHHAEIIKWRALQALEKTKKQRPDLLELPSLTSEDK